MEFPIFAAGLSMGLSLILPIGAQNAFVLRQGLRGEHVLAVTLACALSDAALILIGVAGFARLSTTLPWLDPAMRAGGAVFLLWYGWRNLRAALAHGGAPTGDLREGSPTLLGTLATCLAITWLNPHVYLDTVVLLGSVSAQFPGGGGSFAAGAATGSFLFFFALAYGAIWLQPLFARPLAWRVLDGATGVTMLVLAYHLVTSGT